MIIDIQVEQRDSGARGWMISRDCIAAPAHGLRLRLSYAIPPLSHEVAGALAGNLQT
ncbi:MAG: hypothetical protein ACYDEV_16170 [Acidiferrobacter sp.]